jgi:hypothetical protein
MIHEIAVRLRPTETVLTAARQYQLKPAAATTVAPVSRPRLR